MNQGNAALGNDLVRAAPGGEHRQPFVDEGRYTVFRGSRWLPPSSVPVRVIFQVGNKMRAADHLPKGSLPQVDVKVHEDGATAGGQLPPVPVVVESAMPFKLEECNLLYVDSSAQQRFEQGIASCLCIMEDPRHRGDIEVVPRKLQYMKPPAPQQVREVWKYEKSLFRDYHRESAETFVECFDHDWAASKLEKFTKRYIKDTMQVASLRNFLCSKYDRIMSAFHARSLLGFSLPQASPGLGLIAFTDILSARVEVYEPELFVAELKMESMLSEPMNPTSTARRRSASSRGPDSAVGSSRRALGSAVGSSRKAPDSAGKQPDSVGIVGKKKSRAPTTKAEARPQVREGPIYCPSFATGHSDTICIGANVVDKANPLSKGMSAMPATGLARFQFLEAAVRVASARFHSLPGDEGLEGSVRELLRVLNLGEDLLHFRATLQRALFCEECCMVIEQSTWLLDQAFAHYGKRLRHPGRQGAKTMSYSAWVEFLQDCGAEDCGLRQDYFGLAFAVGRELRVDEFKSLRHMELSWVEFLVCIGATVRLCGAFEEEFFPDRFQEFIQVHVAKAVNAAQLTTVGSKARGPNTNDPGMDKMVDLLGQVFTEADIDDSGTLTVVEFNHMLRKEHILKQFADMGLGTSDFKLLFKRLDSDHSGSITLDEISNGVVELKRALGANERTLAYLYKLFGDADVDNNGSLTKDEFTQLFFHNAQARKKLQSLGCTAEDLDDLWAAVDAADKDAAEGVTREEMAAGFLSLKEDSGIPRQGINYLRQLFKAADVGTCDGKLTRAEVKAVFLTQAVEDKLSSLGLVNPDWIGIFDAIDLDGDGTLTWEEMSWGVSQMWNEFPAMRKRKPEGEPGAEGLEDGSSISGMCDTVSNFNMEHGSQALE